MKQYLINFDEDTVSELKDHFDASINAAADRIIAALAQPRLVKGVAAGIAKPLGISAPTAYALYKSGVLDEAVSRHDTKDGRQIILVDVNKVRELALKVDITKVLKESKNEK